MVSASCRKIEVLIHNEDQPDDNEDCQSCIVLDLLGLKFLLILTYKVMGSLSGLESILHQGAHALILLLLSFMELLAGFFLLSVPPQLQLSFHFIIGERFLALLHTTDVLEVLLLDTLELLDNRGIS